VLLTHAFVQLEISEASIPPFLQTLFVQSKHLVRKAYELESFSLQMIHVCTALLHIIIFWANAFGAMENENDFDENMTMDLLHTSPLHAASLRR